jgi:hypothetical protein
MVDALMPFFDGSTRQRHKGAQAGRKAGRLGGRKRGYNDAHIRTARILKERDPQIGRTRLARQLRVTDEQARAILNELKG